MLRGLKLIKKVSHSNFPYLIFLLGTFIIKTNTFSKKFFPFSTAMSYHHFQPFQLLLQKQWLKYRSSRRLSPRLFLRHIL